MIEVDLREKAGGVAAELRKAGAAIAWTTLKAGDYRIGRALTIERKGAWDFLQSVFDARLFRQLAKLVRHAPRPLLLIEGMAERLGEPVVRGTLLTVTAVFGVPVLFSRDPPDSARWILGAAKQFAARKEEAFARPGWRPRGKLARQIFVLQGLPGVGPVRARRLLERFGSVRAAMAADEKALVEVEGVGPSTARRIVWVAT